MLNFDYLDKGLGIFPQYILCMIFQQKFFCYILITDQIVSCQFIV